MTMGKRVTQSLRLRIISTHKICIDEITKCFDTSPLSLPVFIHLGFDRYGWIPLPVEIKSEDFEQMTEKSTPSEIGAMHSAWGFRINSKPSNAGKSVLATFLNQLTCHN